MKASYHFEQRRENELELAQLSAGRFMLLVPRNIGFAPKQHRRRSLMQDDQGRATTVTADVANAMPPLGHSGLGEFEQPFAITGRHVDTTGALELTKIIVPIGRMNRVGPAEVLRPWHVRVQDG